MALLGSSLGIDCQASWAMLAFQNSRRRDMKPSRKPKSLAKQHEQLIQSVLFFPMNLSSDLRQPDFRPAINSVVSGGVAELPIETWSNKNAQLARGSERDKSR